MVRGGRREGAGKPALYGVRMVRAEILIPQEAKDFFISLGEGNLSAGVRMAWRSLTQPAPDAGESAPLQALSTPEHSATSQALSTPTQRG